MAFADDAKISDLVAKASPGWFSFEYFPPKTDEGVANLKKRIVRMKALKPLFTDFTWGAGGSTSELTLSLTSAAKNEFGCVANMHLTCTNQKTEMCGEALDACKKVGVRNIVALRGDPPRGQDKWTATEGGFSSALDLVQYMRKNYGDYFSISVAGYPEGHPDNIEVVEGGRAALTPSEARRARIVKDESGAEVVTVCRDENFKKEMVYLKEKADAGAEFIITQMFLDPHFSAMPGPSAGYFQASSPQFSVNAEEKDKTIEELARHFVLRSEIEAEIAKQLQLFVGHSSVPGRDSPYPKTHQAGPDISQIQLHREATVPEDPPQDSLDQLRDPDPQGGRRELRETTRQGTQAPSSKRTRLSSMVGQGGSCVTEYKLQESVWDAALFIGLPDIGFFGSLFTALALAVNSTMQVLCILVINANLVWVDLGNDWDPKGLEAWRNQVGHDLKFVSSRHEVSLVDRVCNHDPTLELATNQLNQLDMIDEYLPPNHEVLNGPTMCILAITIWGLCCLRETFATFDALRGVAQLSSSWAVQSMLGETEGGGLVLHQIHTVRKAAVMLTVMARLLLVVGIFLVGSFFLVRTLSISELILNAVALELVMNIDELIFSAVIPLRVAALIRSLAPLPMRPWPDYKGADVRAVIAPLCLIAFFFLTWFGALKNTIDQLKMAKEALCSGNRTFGFEKDGLGIVRIRGLQSFDPDIALEDGDLASRAVRDISHPRSGGSTWQFGLRETLEPLLIDVIVKDMDQTDLRLMMETVQDLYTGQTTGGCVDADTFSPDFWQVVQKYLSKTMLGITGPIANCSQVQRHCSVVRGQRLQDMVLLRALCPQTCGCNSLLSGTAISAPELGCPPGCLEDVESSERQVTPCEDLNVTDPDDARVENMRQFLRQLNPFITRIQPGLNLVQFMEQVGCGFVEHFRTVVPKTDPNYVDLCSSFSGRNYVKFGDGIPIDGKTPKLFTLLCPKTCNCDGSQGLGSARPEEKFCPSSCFTASAPLADGR